MFAPSVRSKAGLLVRSAEPFNAEPTLARLAASFITPTEQFYVRSHGPVPQLDARSWRLSVSGDGPRPIELSLADLKSRFPVRSVTATLQCAGNRRSELNAVRPTAGVQWDAGAIGTATWTGAALGDVLRSAGFGEPRGLHVAFSCHDALEHDGESLTYGASIPATKALSPEVLLAYAMNGLELTPDHGFPLRAVVPGYAGVRSPKWLRAIGIQERPSDNPIQQLDYKLFGREVTKESADWARAAPIDELPLNAAICTPAAGSVLLAGLTEVSGYAVASGRAVSRVEVSPDRGRTWTEAELETGPDQPWAWSLWRARVELARGRHELAVRAWDAAGQTQPASPEEVWNFKGYCCAAWHRVTVEVGSAPPR